MDLFNADVAGGWGQVTMQGSSQFLFNCKVTIGNGTYATFFIDTSKQVVFADGIVTGTNQYFIYINNASVTFGSLVDLEAKTTYNGCQFTNLEDTYNVRFIGCIDASTVLNLYSCTIFGSPSATASTFLYFYTTGVTVRVWNCLLNRGTDMFCRSANIDIYNVVSEHSASTSGTLMEFYSVGVDVERLLTSNCSYGVYIQDNYNSTVRNWELIGNTHVAYLQNFVGEFSLVDCISDLAWHMYYGGTCTGEVYRQYTFDLFVLNGALTDFVEDANVTLTHDGTVFGSWLTNSTGQIETETLTYGFYNQTGGDTMYGGTPWTLTITHPDWETYISAFYPYSEIDWSVSMQDTSTGNNNMLIVGLLVGSLAFLGLVVIRRKQN